jgi:hypothetical protein
MQCGMKVTEIRYHPQTRTSSLRPEMTTTSTPDQATNLTGTDGDPFFKCTTVYPSDYAMGRSQSSSKKSLREPRLYTIAIWPVAKSTATWTFPATIARTDDFE